MVRLSRFTVSSVTLGLIVLMWPFDLSAITIGKPHKASPTLSGDKGKQSEETSPQKAVTPPKPTPPPFKSNKKFIKKTGSNKEIEQIPHLSLGLVYTGAQVRYRFGRRLGLEIRYLRDSATAGTGDVKADVLGGRIYLFTRPQKQVTFFGGGEGASVSEKTEGSDQKIKGTALGGFGGVEYRVSKRFSLGLDVGLYNISLQKTTTSAQESGIDFVINSFLNFHVF